MTLQKEENCEERSVQLLRQNSSGLVVSERQSRRMLADLVQWDWLVHDPKTEQVILCLERHYKPHRRGSTYRLLWMASLIGSLQRTAMRWWPWKGVWGGYVWGGTETLNHCGCCGHICYWSMGLLKAQPNKQRTAEQKERGCQIWSPRIGPMSVLAQIKRECSGNWASTRSGTPTGSHSVREIAPFTLQHLPTILLSICWFTYQETVMCVCVCARVR